MSDDTKAWMVSQINAKDDQVATLRKELEALRRERDALRQDWLKECLANGPLRAQLAKAREALRAIADHTFTYGGSLTYETAAKALADLEGGDDAKAE